MKALVLRSIQELAESKSRALLEDKERHEARTTRMWKLETMNKEIRQANKSRGRREALTHRMAWGVDQRQFSSDALKQKQLECQQLREQRREERRQAVELGRTRIGLDLIPDFPYPLHKPPLPLEDAETCPTYRRTENLEAREYMKFKRKRDLNRERLRELVQERREMRRERALETLEKDCKRGLKRPKTRRKLVKRRGKATDPASENSSKQSLSLRKRIKSMLRDKAESMRDSSLLQPLSLGSIAKAIEFPLKGDDSSTSRMNSSRRRLRRRADGLQERYRMVLERDVTEEAGSGVLQAVRRDLAARVIQRWFRMQRLRKRLRRNRQQKQNEKEKEEESSSLLYANESEAYLQSYRESMPTSGKLSSDLLQKLSLSAVPSAYDSYQTPEEPTDFRQFDHFRDVLVKHIEGLQSHLVGSEVELREVLASLDNQSVESSLIRTVADISLDLMSPKMGGSRESSEEVVWVEGRAEEEEPESKRHGPAGPGAMCVIQEPPEDVPQPLFPSLFPSPPSSSSSSSSSSSPDVSFEQPQGGTNCLSLFSIPISSASPQSPKNLLDLPVNPYPSRRRMRYPGTALRLEIDDINAQFLTPSEVHIDSPILSPIEDLRSPEVKLVPFGQQEARNEDNKVGEREIEEIVATIVDREVTASIGVVVQKAPATVDISPEFLCYLLELLVENVDDSDFMSEITQPKAIDLPIVLSSFSSGSDPPPFIQPLIPLPAFIAVSQFLSSHISDPDANLQLAAYCRMLYECANEALDVIRPESVKGERTPWRPGPTDLHKYKTIFEVFYDVRDLLFAWGSAEIGRFSRDCSDSPSTIANIQEERLSTQLLRDVSSTQVLLEDKVWVDYEREETQCKLDLSDGVFARLVAETAELIGGGVSWG